MKRTITTLLLSFLVTIAFAQKKPTETAPVLPDSSFTVTMTPQMVREISKIVVVAQTALTSSNMPMKEGLPVIQQLELLNRFVLSLQPQPKSAPKK